MDLNLNTEWTYTWSPLWPPDAKNWVIGKDPDVGKDWRQEQKVMTEDEMVGWHHGLNGHEFEQTTRVGDGQGSLAWCSIWGCKELDTTELLNWNLNMGPWCRRKNLEVSPSGFWSRSATWQWMFQFGWSVGCIWSKTRCKGGNRQEIRRTWPGEHHTLSAQ